MLCEGIWESDELLIIKTPHAGSSEDDQLDTQLRYCNQGHQLITKTWTSFFVDCAESCRILYILSMFISIRAIRFRTFTKVFNKWSPPKQPILTSVFVPLTFRAVSNKPLANPSSAPQYGVYLKKGEKELGRKERQIGMSSTYL